VTAKVNAEQIAEWLVAGKTAAQIAELAGVHLRTAYKLIARHKPPAAPIDVPPDFDRAAALDTAIDRAIIALGSEGPAAAERLLTLARSAKLLGLSHRQAPAERDRDAIAEKLALKLEQAAREAYLPPPAPPPGSPPEMPPAAPPADGPPLEGNPWIAPLKVARNPWQPGGNNPDYHEPNNPMHGGDKKQPSEPPTPTKLITKPLTG
jgi:hypothetical protein